MAGTVKKLQFSEGTNVGAPSDLSVPAAYLPALADDATYLADFGTPINGSAYLNTTTGKVRYYLTDWRNAVPESDFTDPAKRFLVDVAGNSTGISATLDFNFTSSRVWTFPDATSTVVGTDTAQAITNKLSIAVDNLLLDGNTLSTTDTNGNLLLVPNGSGDVRTSNDLSLTASGNQNFRMNTLNNGAGLSKIYASDILDIYNGPASESRIRVFGTGAVKFTAYTTGISHFDADGDITSSLIVNADITAGTIGFDKLTSLASANILVGNGSNVATSVSVTGDVTISNTGVTAIGSGKITSTMILNDTILNTDINTAAGIQFSKLESLTSAHILVGSSGNVATDRAVTGVISLSNTGVTSFASGDFGSHNILTTGVISIGAAGNTADHLTIDNNSAEAAIRLQDNNDRYVRLYKSSTLNGFSIFDSQANDHKLFITEGASKFIGFYTATPAQNLHIDHNSSSGGIRIQDNNDRYMELRKNSSNNRTEIFDSNSNKNLFFAQENGLIGADVTSWTAGGTNTVFLSGTTGEVTFQKLTSSIKYKKNVRDLDQDIDTSKIYDLVPRVFDWKYKEGCDFGFIAEEVSHHMLPLINWERTDKELILGENGKPQPASVRYDMLAVLMLAEMKKLKVRLDHFEEILVK